MREIAIIAGADVIGALYISKLCPRLPAIGYTPIIIYTGTQRNRQFKVPAPIDASFYNVRLFDEVYSPFVKRHDHSSATAAFPKPPGQAVLRSPGSTARRLGLRHYVVNDINEAAAHRIYAAHPDMTAGLLVRSLQIAENPMIELFRDRGFLWNLHGGLLPDSAGVYQRGLLLPAWAKINGWLHTGISLHHVGQKIDEGRVIDTAAQRTAASRTVMTAYLSMVDAGVNLIVNALKRQDEKPVVGIPQRLDKAYFPYPTQEQLDAHGVQYCNPIRLVDELCLASGLPDTERLQLRRELIGAVGSHLRAKRDNPDLSLSVADELLLRRAPT